MQHEQRALLLDAEDEARRAGLVSEAQRDRLVVVAGAELRADSSRRVLQHELLRLDDTAARNGRAERGQRDGAQHQRHGRAAPAPHIGLQILDASQHRFEPLVAHRRLRSR
ncbi:MAG: hypothetical protein DMD76_23600 [Candidatus Rokuibacteriota bacterium]|nr:MAG: hypothetical protein DMD76_23600 [Candidatus Rokubacteria bacterium]